jgi:hypothetical protein
MKDLSKFGKVLVRVAFFLIVMILANLIAVYFLGPQIWSYDRHFFDSDIRTTLAVFLFIEGGAVLATGSV